MNYSGFGIVLFTVALLIFLYTKEYNTLTELRIQLPRLEREISSLHAEKVKLEFELEQFFNPARLEDVLKRAQYGYLKQLDIENIILLTPE